MTHAPLPHVDTHTVEVQASPEVVWEALLQVTSRFSGHAGSPLARVLGTDPPGGFARDVEVPGTLLLLSGRHRFSIYALRFQVEPGVGDQSSLLHAVTDAAFPGVRGRAYRGLVVGSGLHRFITRRILASIARASVAAAAGK